MLGRFYVDNDTVFKNNKGIFYVDYFNDEIYQVRVLFNDD